MNPPDYAHEIVEAMKAENRPPWQIIGCLQAILTGIQRDAEEGRVDAKSLLKTLAVKSGHSDAN